MFLIDFEMLSLDFTPFFSRLFPDGRLWAIEHRIHACGLLENQFSLVANLIVTPCVEMAIRISQPSNRVPTGSLARGFSAPRRPNSPKPVCPWGIQPRSWSSRPWNVQGAELEASVRIMSIKAKSAKIVGFGKMGTWWNMVRGLWRIIWPTSVHWHNFSLSTTFAKHSCID